MISKMLKDQGLASEIKLLSSNYWNLFGGREYPVEFFVGTMNVKRLEVRAQKLTVQPGGGSLWFKEWVEFHSNGNLKKGTLSSQARDRKKVRIQGVLKRAGETVDFDQNGKLLRSPLFNRRTLVVKNPNVLIF